MNTADQTFKEYIEALSSSAPTPGGGGAAALAASAGAALSAMVGSLTLGRPKYAAVQEEIAVLKAKCDALQWELLDFSDRDAEAFLPLAEAYGLPKSTEQERAHKAKVMERALDAACRVPLELMEKCCEGVELAREFAHKGTVMAVSDAGVSALLLGAALRSASMNVYINTKAMADRQKAAAINAQADAMLSKYGAVAEAVASDVTARLRGE